MNYFWMRRIDRNCSLLARNCESVIEVLKILGVWNWSVMTLFLFHFWHCQIYFLHENFWLFVLKFSLLRYTGFNCLSDLCLWHTLDEQIRFALSIGWFLVVTFCGRSCSGSCRSMLVTLIKVRNRKTWPSKAFRFCSGVSRLVLCSLRMSFYWVLCILSRAQIYWICQRVLLSLRFNSSNWSSLLWVKSSAFLLTMCFKILKILFSGLRKGKNWSIWLKLMISLRYCLLIHIQTFALFVMAVSQNFSWLLDSAWWRGSFWNITVCLKKRMLWNDLDRFIVR